MNKKRGMVLLIVLVLLATMSVAAVSQLDVLRSESTMTSRREQELLARAAADACMELGTALVNAYMATDPDGAGPAQRPNDFDRLLDPTTATNDEFIPSTASGWTAVSVHATGTATSRFGFKRIAVGAPTDAGCLLRFDDNVDDFAPNGTAGTTASTTSNNTDTEGPTGNACDCNCGPTPSGNNKKCTWDLSSGDPACAGLGATFEALCPGEDADCESGGECAIDDCPISAPLACPAGGGTGNDVRTRDRDRSIFITAVGVYPVQAGTPAVDAYAKAHARVTLKRFFSSRGASAITAGGDVNIGTNADVCGAGGIAGEDLTLASGGCVCGSTNVSTGPTNTPGCAAANCPASSPPCDPTEITTGGTPPAVPEPSLPDKNWLKLSPVDGEDLGDDTTCRVFFKAPVDPVGDYCAACSCSGSTCTWDKTNTAPFWDHCRHLENDNHLACGTGSCTGNICTFNNCENPVCPGGGTAQPAMAFIWDRTDPLCQGVSADDTLPVPCDQDPNLGNTSCGCTMGDFDADGAVDDLFWDMAADPACAVPPPSSGSMPSGAYSCSTSSSGTGQQYLTCSGAISCGAGPFMQRSTGTSAGPPNPKATCPVLSAADKERCWKPIAVLGTTSGWAPQSSEPWEQSTIIAGVEHFYPRDGAAATPNTFERTMSANGSGIPGTSWNAYCTGGAISTALTATAPGDFAYKATGVTPAWASSAQPTWHLRNITEAAMPKHVIAAFEGNLTLTTNVPGSTSAPIRWTLLVEEKFAANNNGARFCCAGCDPAACQAAAASVGPDGCINNTDQTNVDLASVYPFYDTLETLTGDPPDEMPSVPDPPPHAMLPAVLRATSDCDIQNQANFYGSVQCGSLMLNNGFCVAGGAVAWGPPRTMSCHSDCPSAPYNICMSNNAEIVGHLRSDNVGGAARSGDVCFANNAQVFGNVWIDGDLSFKNNTRLTGGVAVSGNFEAGQNMTLVNDQQWEGERGAGVVASGSRDIAVIESSW